MSDENMPQDGSPQAETSVPEETKGVFANNPKLKPAVLVAAIALFIVGAFAVRQYLDVDATGSSANCYGYNCESYVMVGGRLANGSKDSDITYGTLYVKSGSAIELTWSGINVDRCEAIGRWTRFKGTYMAPTAYPFAITQSQSFGVKCKKGRQTFEGYFSVVVE